jgi:hypothetical protein
MPDGSDGYALFINIGVTFSPAITLPYNFNLRGCGGLLALNRTMDVEALRTGLRQRTLDSILFPEDPILNANKIISDSASGGRFASFSLGRSPPPSPISTTCSSNSTSTCSASSSSARSRSPSTRLSPPLKFPKVRRLEPELSSSSSLESSCNCYKALTSNSLQFGSRVEFYGEESGASLEGRLCCDVLIYFSPFRFEADMGAGVTARCRLGREHRVEGHVRPRTDRHVATEYGGRGYRRRRVYVPSLATMLQQHGQAPGSRSHVRTL